MENIFEGTGKWYKGNLHMHTTVSDGKVTPEDAITQYKMAGYDFVAVTDHWKQCREDTAQEILVLPGVELDTGDMINSPIYHIIGVGMQGALKLDMDNTRDPQELIDYIRAAGGIAILAHPAWSVTDPDCVMRLTNLSGVEIYNTISDIPFGNGARADSSMYFDLWATKGRSFRAMAADDSHWYTGEQTRSYIMVNAAACTRDAIINAIEEGSFYASQGPEFIQISKDLMHIEVECRNAVKAVFYSNCVYSSDRVKEIKDGHAEYQINRFDRYIRVELIDEAGNKAWCTPFSIA